MATGCVISSERTTSSKWLTHRGTLLFCPCGDHGEWVLLACLHFARCQRSFCEGHSIPTWQTAAASAARHWEKWPPVWIAGSRLLLLFGWCWCTLPWDRFSAQFCCVCLCVCVCVCCLLLVCRHTWGTGCVWKAPSEQPTEDRSVAFVFSDFSFYPSLSLLAF